MNFPTAAMNSARRPASARTSVQQPSPLTIRHDRFAGHGELLGPCLHNFIAPKYSRFLDDAESESFDAHDAFESCGQLSWTRESSQVTDSLLVRAHTSNDFYKQLNMYLRQDSEHLHSWSKYLSLLLQTMSTLPKAEGYSFRAAYLSNDDLNVYVPGRRFRWRTFVSTTNDNKLLTALKDTNNAFFIIRLGPTTNARSVSQLSVSPQESEVLIAPYQRFVVESSELKNGYHHITIAPDTAPRQSGFHVLCRANEFDSDANITTQNDVVALAEQCDDIQKPVYFEKKNEYATAFVDHCDDDMEWKVIVIGECADAFLPDLMRSAAKRVVSVLIYPNGASVDLRMVQRYPMICSITETYSEVLDFIINGTMDTAPLANR